MPKASPIQSTFNSGEFSPLMLGRVDFDLYKTALQTCLNGIPLVQGGWTRRPGTYFSNEVKDSTAITRVVSFKFSTTQAYIIEFGASYVRFNRNNGPVLETAVNITGATQANPVVVTAAAHGYSNGDHVEIFSVGGMTQINNRRFKVAGVAANTFQLQDLGGTNVNGTAFGAYTAGGTAQRAYTVATPYAAADLFNLRFTQSADVLYIFHPGYAPRKLSRTGHTNWTLSTIVWLDGPYMKQNTTATTLTPSAATGTGVTLTASSTVGINTDTGFQTTDVGRLVRIKEGSTWGYVRITGWTSTTVVTVDVINTLTNTNAKTAWRMGLWSDTTGYPACGTFNDDRLIMGGNTSEQQRFDGSRTGDYENMAPSDTDGTVSDSHAISFTMNSNDVQVIRWLLGLEKGLLSGTAEGEWLVRPSTASAALTPTNVNAKQSSARGSANVQALKIGEEIVYVHKSGRKLREMSYVYQKDGYQSVDITRLSEHITKAATAATSGIKEMAHQQEPQSVIWAVRNDGVLLGFTYERDEKVFAWHRHTLGGWSDAGHTAGAKVESVATIPSQDGTRDEVWLVVQRYINGRSVRYIEYMTKIWEKDDVQEDAVYGDCALTYEGSAVTSIAGLFHLAGETVQILADGAARPEVTVSALGAVTLTRSASVVQFGYSYNSDGKSLRPEAGSADGTAQGKTQRTHRLALRLFDTLGLKIGANFNASGPGALKTITFRTSNDNTGAAVPLYTGDKSFLFDGSYTDDNVVCWRFDGMLPATVLALMPQLHTQDRT